MGSSSGGGIMGGAGAMFGIGPDDEKAAAQGAANEQQATANMLYKGFLDRSTANSKQMNLLAANPQQLQALTESLNQASKQADSDQKLMDAIDPSIMEASKQALAVMQGGGPANNSLMQQSNAQRQQLVNSLREQYGPGAETSAVGQNALRQFDLQANAQNQQSLGQLFGMAQSGAGQRAQMGSNIQNRFGQAAQGFGGYAGQQMNAQQGGFNAQEQGLAGYAQGVMNSAGASYTGLMLQGQNRNQWAKSNVGAASAGFGAGKGGGGSPSQTKGATQGQQGAAGTSNGASEYQMSAGTGGSMAAGSGAAEAAAL